MAINLAEKRRKEENKKDEIFFCVMGWNFCSSFQIV